MGQHRLEMQSFQFPGLSWVHPEGVAQRRIPRQPRVGDGHAWGTLERQAKSSGHQGSGGNGHNEISAGAQVGVDEPGWYPGETKKERTENDQRGED